MSANPYLADAIKIFKELGWENATLDNFTTLPLGTKEQRKIALQGLKKDSFNGLVTENGKDVYKTYYDVNSEKLSIFAILLGVDARRAIELLYYIRNRSKIVDILSTRDEKFAQSFIRSACTKSFNPFKKEAVQLFYKYDFEVPENPFYINQWAELMALAMGLDPVRQPKEAVLTYDEYATRFLDHIRVGVNTNADAVYYFGDVFYRGFELNLMTRGEAIEFAFSALDSATRPSDRKVWVEMLEKLKVTDKELEQRVEALIPVMATGDSIAISSLAPRLIKLSKDDTLIELLMSTLGVKTKKAKLLVLKAATERPCPTNVENISDWLNVLAEDKDSSIATTAKKLLEKWSVEVVETESVIEIEGLWRATPSLWEVPKFEIGEVSEEALADVLVEVLGRHTQAHDLLFEKFVSMVCEVAYKDIEACKRSLVGLKNNESTILLPFIYFVLYDEKSDCWYGKDTGEELNRIYAPLLARNYELSKVLGMIPCLLSTPSMEDMTINFSDFVKRVKLYAEKELFVLESDLITSLLRIDLSTVNSNDLEILGDLTVYIKMQNGKKMSVDVYSATKTYLDNVSNCDNSESLCNLALPSFPKRLMKSHYVDMYSVMPNGDDFTLYDIYWVDGVYHEKGLIYRQIAKRRKPLPTRATMNFIASQRSSSQHAIEDAHLAVIEAWERGLLNPNVADTKALYKNGKAPTHLVLLATALENIGREGILSVVWPILDDVVGMSLEEVKMLTGTAEICDVALTFLPEVFSAIEKGLTDNSVLELKNIRELAKKGGSSKAVVTAKAIVSQLPSLESLGIDAMDEPKSEINFDEVWKVNKEKATVYEDDVTLTIEEYVVLKETYFLYNLFLPDYKDYKYQLVVESSNDIVHKDVIKVKRVDKDFVTPVPVQIWKSFSQKAEGKTTLLRYDKDIKKFVVIDLNTKFHQPPLSISQITILIGLFGQKVSYDASRFIENRIDSKVIDDNIIKIVMKRLFEFDIMNPSKFVKLLEKDNKYLYAYWPMLSESIRLASEKLEETGKLPSWLNRVLDVSLFHGEYLKEAIKRGFISVENGDFVGLDKLANAKVKSTAVQKAKDLKGILGI